MKRISDKLALYFLGCVYAFILMYLLATVVYKNVPLGFIILVSLSSYMIISLLMAYKITRSVFISMAGLAGLAVGYLYIAGRAGFITEKAEGMVNLWYKIIYGELIYLPDSLVYADLFMLLSSVLCAVLLVIFYNRYFKFFILTGIMITMFVFSWFMTGIENGVVLAVICVLTVVSYIRHVYEKKLKNGLANEKFMGSLMIFSVPAAIIPVMIIMMLPKSNLPIQWPWLDQKIMTAIQYIEQRFSHSNVEFFSLSTTGFNGRSERLGGPIRPSNTIVMDVKADKRTYLRGAAYSWYENNIWAQIKNDNISVITQEENERESEETRYGWFSIPINEMFPDASLDDIELLRGLSTGRFHSLLFPTYQISVNYRNMTTKSVFIPLKTNMPIQNEYGYGMPMTENLHGIVVSNAKLTTGSSYSLDYIQPMYGEPMLKKALSFSRNNLYKDSITNLSNIKNTLRKQLENNGIYADDITEAIGDPSITTVNSERLYRLSSINRKIDTLSEFYERSKQIEEEYTQISDNIPSRVRDLALELTKDCTNNYEKVIRIESYLRENYKYTLNASRIPEGRDFVDWFLFEDNKGYCTYYATAMTILLRYNGIPARYVEGYVLPEEPDENGIYTVSNRNAHAWVEVYFEGFGWLTFEPTSAYADVMNYRALDDSKVLDVTQMAGYEDILNRYASYTGIPGYEPEDVMPDTLVTNHIDYLKYTLYFIGGIMLLLIFINLSSIFFNRIIMMKLKNKNMVIRYYEVMLRWLSNAGYRIKPGETAIEFGRRIDKDFSFCQYSFESISIIFSKVRYGGYDVSTEEIKMIQNVGKELKKHILKEIGFKRFIPLRHIILGI